MKKSLNKEIGTVIVLSYGKGEEGRSLSDVMDLIKRIEYKISDKEGLKLHISTEYEKNNRVHHHILINKKVEIKIEEEWRNGHASISYIKDDDHYREVINYMMKINKTAPEVPVQEQSIKDEIVIKKGKCHNPCKLNLIPCEENF